jgi:chromatin segregation and condensation protein Rec8/ScpA/Scc1 (kleisin family)
MDLYLMEIEKKMTELYALLQKLAAKGKPVAFTRIIAGFKKLEAIKTFITLLFLAQAGKITLWQEENLADIFITISEAISIGE